MHRQMIKNHVLLIDRFVEAHTIDLVCDSPYILMSYQVPYSIVHILVIFDDLVQLFREHFVRFLILSGTTLKRLQPFTIMLFSRNRLSEMIFFFFFSNIYCDVMRFLLRYKANFYCNMKLFLLSWKAKSAISKTNFSI